MVKLLIRSIGLVLSIGSLLVMASCQGQPTGSSEPGDSVSSSRTESSAVSADETSTSAPDSDATPISDFQYTLVNGKVSITRYTGRDQHVIIPDSINGCPVFSIGYDAFSQNRILTSISFPDSVTEILSGAFSMCSSLSSLELPAHLETLGSMAFSECSSLTSIRIPKSITTWDNAAFRDCTSLKNVELEEGLQTLGATGTFVGCHSLTSITFPESLSTIPWTCFMDCPALSSVTIPEGGVTIETGAFSETALTSVVIPKSVQSMELAFDSCSTLSSIQFDGPPPADLTSKSFATCDPDIVLYYHEGTEGWTSPTYEGYQTEIW